MIAPEVAAGINKVKGAKQRGVRAGKWLERSQAAELLGAPADSTCKSLRDRAIFGVLLGCALRRSELVALKVEDIQQRSDRWVLPDLRGKGNGLRTVPLPGSVKEFVDGWLITAGITSGPVFRPVTKANVVGVWALTENAVWWIVREYAVRLAFGKLAPTISDGPARGCAGNPEVPSSKSSCCSGTSRFKRPWTTSARNRI